MPFFSWFWSDLQSGGLHELEGGVGWGEDSDWVRSREALGERGGLERGHQGCEGRVGGEEVERGAGQSARAGRHGELQGGRGGRSRRQRRARQIEGGKRSSKPTKRARQLGQHRGAEQGDQRQAVMSPTNQLT